MEPITEADLRVRIPNGMRPSRFDGKEHGLSHCMKAVDYIVEAKKVIYFIEFKDPDDPAARNYRNVEDFMAEFKSDKLIDKLVGKCRDTFLYKHLQGIINKPIVYLVLVGAEVLTPADLLMQTEKLKKKLPLKGPNGTEWEGKFIESCLIMNLESWNRHINEMPAERISAT